MTAFSETVRSGLAPWLSRELAPISDADPATLASYILALLTHDQPLPELRLFVKDQLYAFLLDETDAFVNKLFDHLERISPSSTLPAPTRSPLADRRWSRSPSPYSRRTLNNENHSSRRRRRSISPPSKDNPDKRDRVNKYAARHLNSERTRGRCRDYDQKGVCLRGEACPFEHGDDRIVVDASDSVLARKQVERRGHVSWRGGNQGEESTQFERVLPSDRQDNSQNSTLIVERIPSELCSEENVREYFSRFGQLVQVRIQPSFLRASLQFTSHEEASKAIASPEAIFGNRFVRVYWRRTDRRSLVNTNASASANVDAGISSSGFNDEASLKRREQLKLMLEIQKQKEALIQKQIEEQKRLLEKLNSADISDSDKSEILKSLRSISDSIKSDQSNIQSATEKSKSDNNAQFHSHESGKPILSYSGARGSFRTRGFRGAAYSTRSVFTSRTLDNRTCSILVKNIPEELCSIESVTERFSKYGVLEQVQQQADRSFVVQFKTRFAAESAFGNSQLLFRVPGSDHVVSLEWYSRGKESDINKVSAENDAIMEDIDSSWKRSE